MIPTALTPAPSNSLGHLASLINPAVSLPSARRIVSAGGPGVNAQSMRAVRLSDVRQILRGRRG
jgi:hypothetical protein